MITDALIKDDKHVVGVARGAGVALLLVDLAAAWSRPPRPPPFCGAKDHKVLHNTASVQAVRPRQPALASPPRRPPA